MEQHELLRYIVRSLESAGIRYLITGSMASMIYGEPRFTNDVDIVIQIHEEDISRLKGCFPENEFYFSEDAAAKALRNKGQFNVIHPSTGFKIDFVIRKDEPFDDSRFGRIKRLKATEDTEANFASPEDVIIKKMQYYKMGGSEKHLRDITGILKVSKEMIDYGYIENWAKKLELSDVWQAILKRIGIRSKH
ncbi:MAG: hypothetical protein HW382_1283 [Deltaproteobacteria bacterium]|nr:hypothetical protein [Deltaproteobacteria bacterium]